jgi:hypothetical protein
LVTLVDLLLNSCFHPYCSHAQISGSLLSAFDEFQAGVLSGALDNWQRDDGPEACEQPYADDDFDLGRMSFWRMSFKDISLDEAYDIEPLPIHSLQPAAIPHDVASGTTDQFQGSSFGPMQMQYFLEQLGSLDDDFDQKQSNGPDCTSCR